MAVRKDLQCTEDAITAEFADKCSAIRAQAFTSMALDLIHSPWCAAASFVTISFQNKQKRKVGLALKKTRIMLKLIASLQYSLVK